MEKTPHIMLIGEGADQFAAEMGVPKVDPSELVTPIRRKEWEFDNYDSMVSEMFNTDGSKDEVRGHGVEGHDTVGAVALDLKGNFAAATSTGGISLQKVGRVGDSPLVGSGACCDVLGGVSTTGHGESIAKVVLAHRVLSQLNGSSGGNLEQAMKDSLGFMLERVGGRGGVIGISDGGVVAKYHTTPRMSWASVGKDGVRESGFQAKLRKQIFVTNSDTFT